MAEDRSPRRRTEATKQPKPHRSLNPGLLRWFLLVVPIIFAGAGTYVVINSSLFPRRKRATTAEKIAAKSKCRLRWFVLDSKLR